MKSPLKTPYVAATTTAAGAVSRMPGLTAWTTATAYRKKKMPIISASGIQLPGTVNCAVDAS